MVRDYTCTYWYSPTVLRTKFVDIFLESPSHSPFHLRSLHLPLKLTPPCWLVLQVPTNLFLPFDRDWYATWRFDVLNPPPPRLPLPCPPSSPTPPTPPTPLLPYSLAPTEYLLQFTPGALSPLFVLSPFRRLMP